MVSARPQFEAACQLHEFAGLAQWECRELVPLRRVFDSLDQLQVLWRDWPNGLGAGLWLQLREFDSLISPQMGGSYKGITHGLHPCNASSSLAPSTKVWLGNSTAECWSEKPVDTVQFRAEPPRSGCRVAATHMSWAHVHAGSTPATRTISLT